MSQLTEQVKRAVKEGDTPSEIMLRTGATKVELLTMIAQGDIPSFGDPEIWSYIVSQRPRDSGLWPRQHGLAIMAAKEACDLGKANLTYGYQSHEILVMYSFPLKARVYRKPWFFGDMGAGR